MYRTLYKDAIKEIKQSLPRFLSIFLIMLLGVSFFVGIRATGSSMIETARQHFNTYRLPDGQIISTLGLSQIDKELLEAQSLEVSEIRSLETTLEQTQDAVKVYAYTQQPYFYLVEGDFPKTKTEIVLDVKYQEHFKLGESITLKSSELTASEDEEVTINQGLTLSQSTFTIVGFADSSLYYARTTRGASNIYGFVLVNDTVVIGDLYTELYYWNPKVKNLQAYTAEYDEAMLALNEQLKIQFNGRASQRVQEIKQDAQQHLQEARDKINEGYDALKEGEDELNQAQDSLEQAQDEIKEGQAQLRQAQEEYQSGRLEWEQGQVQLAQAQDELVTNRATLNAQEELLYTSWEVLQTQIEQFESQKQQIEKLFNAQQAEVDSGELDIETQRDAYNHMVSQWESGVVNLYDQQNDLLHQLQSVLPSLEIEPEEDVLWKKVQTNQIVLNNAVATLQQEQEKLDEQVTQWDEQLLNFETYWKSLLQQSQDISEQIEQHQELTNTLTTELETLTQQQEQLNDEYTALVTKQTTTTLTPQEQVELEQIEYQIEQLTIQANTYISQKEQLMEELDELLQHYQEIQIILSQSPEEVKEQWEQEKNIVIEKRVELEESLKQAQLVYDKLDDEYLQLEEFYQMLQVTQSELDNAAQVYEQQQMQFEEEKTAAFGQLSQAEIEISRAKEELQAARVQLDQGWNLYNAGIYEIQQQQLQLEQAQQTLQEVEAVLLENQQTLQEAQQSYDQGIQEYQENQLEFERTKEDTLEELKQAEAQLSELEKELDELEVPTYFFNLRNRFDSYDTLYDNAQQINQISRVFPLIFFAIALLVTFTTIKRMVSEQRLYMGTLKQLGYRDRDVMIKFLVYAVTATMIAIVIGIPAGYRIFPAVIMNAYNYLFHFDQPVIVRSFSINSLVIVIALSCAIIPAIWTPMRLLKAPTATLLVPEAPKAGQRILLERIAWIWRRLSFMQKLTIRNILRYKGRNLMTLIGVAGCTMLIVTGLGISDTIEGLVERQFQDIQLYDDVVYLNSTVTEDDNMAIQQIIEGTSALALPIHIETWTTDEEVGEQSVTLVVPLGTYDQFFKLEDPNSQDRIDLNQFESVVTQRLVEYVRADRTGFVPLKKDSEQISIEVDAVAENYIGHMIYLSEKRYDEYFNAQPTVNGYFIRYQNSDERSEIQQALSSVEAVSTIMDYQAVQETTERSMDSLRTITIVLIVSAAGLAFIVLYNLTNINISERMRELSTIKVLGFYDSEVGKYIFNEIFLLTFIGSCIGLILGRGLTQYILKTIQMPNIYFNPKVSISSYLIALILTFIFSISVMSVMYLKIKVIDMVEALKSVD